MSVVSPWANSGVSTTTFKVGTGRFFIVIATSSGGLGGQSDAEKRVDDVVNQVKADLDAARKATLHLSLWLAASMLLSAFAAAIAAAEGGAIRDRNWGVRTEY